MEPNDIHPGLSSLLAEPCFIRNPVQAVLHFQEIFLSNWLLINCCGAVLTNMQLHQQSFSAEGTLHHALQGRKENGENSWKEEADKEGFSPTDPRIAKYWDDLDNKSLDDENS